MIVTNNKDFYQYLTNRGVICMYVTKPADFIDAIVIVFPTTHNSTCCGNRFNKEKENDYRYECDVMIDWLECSKHVIMITPVIKFDSDYMKRVATKQYKRLQGVKYHKQLVHTRDLGELLVPHKLQIRYVGVKPIEFDIVDTHMWDFNYVWESQSGKMKRQQLHYINCLKASHDTETRRKLRAIPEFAVFSQLYKKLCL